MLIEMLIPVKYRLTGTFHNHETEPAGAQLLWLLKHYLIYDFLSGDPAIGCRKGQEIVSPNKPHNFRNVRQRKKQE